jgi:hypothetical protein
MMAVTSKCTFSLRISQSLVPLQSRHSCVQQIVRRPLVQSPLHQRHFLKGGLNTWLSGAGPEESGGTRSPGNKSQSAIAASRKAASAMKHDDKILHLVRHGVTEMNVFLGSAPQGELFADIALLKYWGCFLRASKFLQPWASYPWNMVGTVAGKSGQCDRSKS